MTQERSGDRGLAQSMLSTLTPPCQESGWESPHRGWLRKWESLALVCALTLKATASCTPASLCNVTRGWGSTPLFSLLLLKHPCYTHQLQALHDHTLHLCPGSYTVFSLASRYSPMLFHLPRTHFPTPVFTWLTPAYALCHFFGTQCSQMRLPPSVCPCHSSDPVL